MKKERREEGTREGVRLSHARRHPHRGKERETVFQEIASKNA